MQQPKTFFWNLFQGLNPPPTHFGKLSILCRGTVAQCQTINSSTVSKFGLKTVRASAGGRAGTLGMKIFRSISWFTWTELSNYHNWFRLLNESLMPYITLSLYQRNKFVTFTFVQMVTMEAVAINSDSVCTFAPLFLVWSFAHQPICPDVDAVLVNGVAWSAVDVKNMEVAWLALYPFSIVLRSWRKCLRSRQSCSRLIFPRPLVGFPRSSTSHQLQQSQLELGEVFASFALAVFYLSLMPARWFISFNVWFPPALLLCLSEHFWRGGETQTGENGSSKALLTLYRDNCDLISEISISHIDVHIFVNIFVFILLSDNCDLKCWWYPLMYVLNLKIMDLLWHNFYKNKNLLVTSLDRTDEILLPSLWMEVSFEAWEEL